MVFVYVPSLQLASQNGEKTNQSLCEQHLNCRPPYSSLETDISNQILCMIVVVLHSKLKELGGRSSWEVLILPFFIAIFCNSPSFCMDREEEAQAMKTKTIFRSKKKDILWWRNFILMLVVYKWVNFNSVRLTCRSVCLTASHPISEWRRFVLTWI